jgi:opine dehydrogenase
MSSVAVLGAGAGGLSAVVELSRAGHDVRLWNRNPATLRPHVDAGGIRYEGVLGGGMVELPLMTTDLGEALLDAEVAVVCLPALAHQQVFDDLAAADAHVPVVLNPGHTGGALHLRACFIRAQAAPPPVAELSTLTYVARTAPDGRVHTSGRADAVRGACLPGGAAALDWAMRLFPRVFAAPDVMATSLSNINLVLHPPGAVLSAAWVEATGGDFRFYVDAMTPAVVRVLVSLDDERRELARAFGHELPSLADEMAAVGTVDREAAARGDLMAAIRGGAANQAIRAPSSLEHRYYREDLPYALLPFTVLADIAGVSVVTASALLAVGCSAAGLDPSRGLDRVGLGLIGRDLDGVLALVRDP